MNEDWLTVQDTAARVGVSTKTIYKYVKEGRLKAYRRGPRSIAISIDDLDALYRPFGTSYVRGW